MITAETKEGVIQALAGTWMGLVSASIPQMQQQGRHPIEMLMAAYMEGATAILNGFPGIEEKDLQEIAEGIAKALGLKGLRRVPVQTAVRKEDMQ